MLTLSIGMLVNPTRPLAQSRCRGGGYNEGAGAASSLEPGLGPRPEPVCVTLRAEGALCGLLLLGQASAGFLTLFTPHYRKWRVQSPANREQRNRCRANLWQEVDILMHCSIAERDVYGYSDV